MSRIKVRDVARKFGVGALRSCAHLLGMRIESKLKDALIKKVVDVVVVLVIVLNKLV